MRHSVSCQTKPRRSSKKSSSKESRRRSKDAGKAILATQDVSFEVDPQQKVHRFKCRWCQRTHIVWLVVIALSLALVYTGVELKAPFSFVVSSIWSVPELFLLDAFQANIEQTEAFLKQLRTVSKDGSVAIMSPDFSSQVIQSLQGSQNTTVLLTPQRKRDMWLLMIQQLQKHDAGTHVYMLPVGSFLQRKIRLKYGYQLMVFESDNFVNVSDSMLLCRQTRPASTVHPRIGDFRGQRAIIPGVLFGTVASVKVFAEEVLAELGSLGECEENMGISAVDLAIQAAVLHLEASNKLLIQRVKLSEHSMIGTCRDKSDSAIVFCAEMPYWLVENANAAAEAYVKLTRTGLYNPGAVVGVNIDQRNLVIGTAVNIDLKFLTVFVRSLRRFSNAQVTLFMDEGASDSHRALLRKYAIDCIIIDLESTSPAYIRDWHPSSYRWKLAFDYLVSPAALQARRILSIDVRDSAFQSDPFDIVEQKGLYVFLEAPPKTIADCTWNSGWVKDCFGKTVFEAVKSNPISCSGVSIGTRASMIRYAERMSTLLSIHRLCERNGVDQGVHNVMIWQELQGNAKFPLHIETIRTGKVANVQSMVQVRLGRNQLFNSVGEPYAIVHQYDRSDAFQEFYFAMYPADEAPPAGTRGPEVAEQ